MRLLAAFLLVPATDPPCFSVIPHPRGQPVNIAAHYAKTNHPINLLRDPLNF
jgi:hypothetical protein